MPVEAAGAAFAAVYAAMHAECFHDAWSTEAFAALFAGPGVYGLIATGAGGAPVGFALCRVAADEAEVLTIGVIPAHRGAGVGHLLLEQALAEAASRGAARMFLEVSETNRAARALYAAQGFVGVGTRKKYYREFIDERETRVDAYVLSKKLEPGESSSKIIPTFS